MYFTANIFILKIIKDKLKYHFREKDFQTQHMIEKKMHFTLSINTITLNKNSLEENEFLKHILLLKMTSTNGIFIYI